MTNREIIKKATVIIPAIIWFSVKLEANIPTDNVAKLMRINPNIATNTEPKFGSPKKVRIK